MKRIGVAFPGDPLDRTTWSGTPSGVIRGLEEAGLEAVPICVEPARLLRALTTNALTAMYLRPARDMKAAIRRGRACVRVSPMLAIVHTWAAPKRVRQAGALDGIVQIGTGYSLATNAPIATFEDMTIIQTRGRGYAGWSDLSARGRQLRVARQSRAYEQAIACCLTSRWAAESLVRDYGISPSKVHVVGVGANHSPPQVERDWRRPRFLFVGMDWEGKNGDGVLRAFARLRAERPDARLDLVGGHPCIDRPGVVCHGVLRLDVAEQHARLERLFAASTCFVMPSHAEAAGIAYVEAAAAGLPCIGTSAGGSDYLIGDGGLIVDPRDDAALVGAMRTLAAPQTAAATGAAAKVRSEMFTWRNVADRLVRALDGARPEIDVCQDKLIGP